MKLAILRIKILIKYYLTALVNFIDKKILKEYTVGQQ